MPRDRATRFRFADFAAFLGWLPPGLPDAELLIQTARDCLQRFASRLDIPVIFETWPMERRAFGVALVAQGESEAEYLEVRIADRLATTSWAIALASLAATRPVPAPTEQEPYALPV